MRKVVVKKVGAIMRSFLWIPVCRGVVIKKMQSLKG